MIKVAVFVSGRGSNLRAIVNYFKLNRQKVSVNLVISNKPDCPAFNFAQENEIQTFVVKSKNTNKSFSWDEILNILKKNEIDLIVLAGFLKKIPNKLVKEFRNRIINIHPALLPSFGGEGMYGMNVHRAVFESSAKVSGATVHFVNEKYDEGKIIAQKCVDISDVNSPEEIAERVLKIEHEILPAVIEKFADNKIQIENNRVILK